MNQWPTFKEFNNSKHDKIVMSDDGHYFLVRTNHDKLYKVITVLFNVILTLTYSTLVALDIIWLNVFFDAYILILVFERFITHVKYNHTDFECIDENANVYEETIDWFHSRKKSSQNARAFFSIAFLLFAFFNSFSFLYIVNQIAKPPVVSSVEIISGSDSFPVQTRTNQAILQYSGDGTDIRIKMETAFAINPVSASLDGVPLSLSDPNMKMSWFWNQQLFVRTYYFSTSLNSKESILEISNESFSHKWILKALP